MWSSRIVDIVRERSVAARFADAQADPRLGEARSVMAQSICASMCAPLRPRDEVVGVLYVDNQSATNPFAEADLDFLGAFANQAAIALDNSRLYQRIEAEAVLRNNLLRFFPPTAIGKLISPEAGPLETIDTEVTALFADLSSFTALSSTMAPREVVRLLNEYFPAMAEVVFRHEGTLEKYIGDALLAVWGAPFRHDDDVLRAVTAAVEMQRALRRPDRPWAARGLELSMHVGLNTGPVAAGNIGSERYIQYATIGDATNLASRICGAAGADEILISEATRARLGACPFRVVAVPPVTVKGKAEPLLLHRVEWNE
jgi:adenylate cyclase